MSTEKAVEISQKVSGGADSGARRLIQTALANPKCVDNITVLVVAL